MIDFTPLGNQAEDIFFTHEQLEEIIDYTVFASGNPFVDEDTKVVIERVFLSMTGHPQEAEVLAFGNTSWQVKITPNLVKTSVVASLMIGLLHASGATQLASLVLPAVLPLLVDIESIRLSVKDDLILSEMRRHEHLKDKEFWPQELYEQLHEDTRQQFTFAEFLEVLDALSLTGDVNWDEDTGLFKINEKKQFKIRIS